MTANTASARILIKGGKVVNDDCTQEADVYIENGIIQQVGRELMIPGGAKVIDATGKLVIPGGIDTSTHFHQTFMNATCMDDFYNGTKVRTTGGSLSSLQARLMFLHCIMEGFYCWLCFRCGNSPTLRWPLSVEQKGMRNPTF